MNHSQVTQIDINTFYDIEDYFDKLTKGENVKIGNVADNITVAIKLDGGRFSKYKAPYVNTVIAKTVIAHQDSYKKIVSILKKDYKITSFDEQLMLQFRLEEGCCEVTFEDIKEILLILKDMPVEVQTAVIATLLIGGLGIAAYKLISQKMNDNKEIAREKIQANKDKENLAEHNRHTEKIIELIEQITSNKNLEKAINEPKEKILKQLNIDENLSYQTNDGKRTKVITKNEIETYKVDDEDKIEEVETTEIITVTITNISYGNEEQFVKVKGNSHLFNRDLLSFSDKIELSKRADKYEPLDVEVKFIKEKNSGKILRAYLLKIVN